MADGDPTSDDAFDDDAPLMADVLLTADEPLTVDAPIAEDSGEDSPPLHMTAERLLHSSTTVALGLTACGMRKSST